MGEGRLSGLGLKTHSLCMSEIAFDFRKWQLSSNIVWRKSVAISLNLLGLQNILDGAVLLNYHHLGPVDQENSLRTHSVFMYNM